MQEDELLLQLQQSLGDNYTVERELARGGMSRVYLAQDKSLVRAVVIKALSPELAVEVNFERFAREIRLAGRLQNPHIVPLLSAGDAKGTPFFVMPYVEGESLRQKLAMGGELPVHDTIRILRDVATALDYAHKRGIVHRDIKPENILLSSGTAVVTDFGVAKAVSTATQEDGGATNLTTAGVALGTPLYMAPEQASADPSTDHRADIYAWGAVAYEMLTGAPPFAGRATQAILAAHIAEPVPPIHRAGAPPRLLRLVMRALSKRPADRPQSAQELVLELDGVMATGITPSEGTSVSSISSRRGKLIATLLIMAAVAAGAFGYFRYGPTVGDARVALVRRIAVLPFTNASGTKDEEYFADGMSDELGAVLGRLNGIQVAAHGSAFSFKGQNIDVGEVGRKLNVDAVLEGRVRRAGSRLRVTAQLTDVSNGLSLWSDSYERDAKDVFAVQDDIARAIGNALEVRFLAKAAGASLPDAQGTADPDAYDLFLRGRFFWHKRGAENLRKSIDLFTAAVARDPKFARAYAALASSEALIAEYADDPPLATHELALRAADKALAIDPKVAEAYIARGLVDVHLWKWDDARKAYQTAIALDSTSATAHQWYGELFYTLGEMDSALAETRAAKALDPLAPVPSIALSYTLYGARHYREAVQEGRLAGELAPDLSLIPRVMAMAYLHIGDSANALAEARRTVELEPSQSRGIAIFAYVAGAIGRRAEAVDAMKKLRQQHASTFAILLADLGVGDRASALAELKAVIDARDPALSQYPLIDPVFDSIRGTAEFQRAVVAAGTPMAGVPHPDPVRH